MKIRVYEIARKLNSKSSVIIKKLNDFGIEAKSNFSGIEEKDAERFMKQWSEKKKSAIKEVKSKTKKVVTDNKNTKKEMHKEKPKTDPKPQENSRTKRRFRKEAFIEAVTPQKLKTKKKYKKTEKEQEENEESNILKLSEGITVFELAEKLNVDFSEIISKFFELGVMLRKNDIVDLEASKIIADEYGFKVEEEVIKSTKFADLMDIEDKKEDLQPRHPIVTVMGHVDHGKTSILDAIKTTNVAQKEAGGITQHMAAYSVKVKGKYITFLDTPGHEAFTEMRARGAQITDIVILVVAADDGVMPQTIEAINHSKAAGVPIVVAINKIDKPNANPDRVIQELSNYGIISEEWGGENIFVKVSAKKHLGINDLLESILLQAEVMELTANPNKRAKAVVVESKLDKRMGPIATVVVKEGTLRQGDFYIVGAHYGKARALMGNNNKKVKKVLPSFATVITGIHGVPEAGDTLIVVKDEQSAKKIAEERQREIKKVMLNKNGISLENIFEQVKEGEIQELPIILKTDVNGSVEAIDAALSKLSTDEVSVKLIHSGVGAITKSDINLASASNAIVLGFNVRPTQEALKISKDMHIDVRTYSVIYDIIDDIKKSLSGLLSPEEKEEAIGRAEVRDTFKVPKIGIVAGCYVTYGKVTRNARIRILRDGVIIHDGPIMSLKRFKDDVSEVKQGYECGIGVENFNDIKAGDFIEAYVINKIQREL